MLGVPGCTARCRPQKNINNITANNIQWPDPQEKAFQMFLAWHNKGVSLTSEQLSAALIHVGRQDLAENLEHRQVNGDLKISTLGKRGPGTIKVESDQIRLIKPGSSLQQPSAALIVVAFGKTRKLSCVSHI